MRLSPFLELAAYSTRRYSHIEHSNTLLASSFKFCFSGTFDLNRRLTHFKHNINLAVKNFRANKNHPRAEHDCDNILTVSLRYILPRVQ